MTELAEKLPADVDARREHVVELRRWLHRHPELSFNEAETAARVVSELERLGIPCSYPGPGGGVIGRLVTDPALPTIALRAELDALPGSDLTDPSYRSVYADRMHACGHDAHMTMVLGAAALLARDPPDGTVVLIFQPAEEGGGGAREMIKDGLFDQFPMEAVFGAHNWPGMPVGHFALKNGPCFASSNDFTITIRGNMAVGITGDDLMVRMEAGSADAALSEPHARPMDFTGKPMKGFLYVGPEGVRTQKMLEKWVGRGVDYASGLPAKKPKSRKPRKKS